MSGCSSPLTSRRSPGPFRRYGASPFSCLLVLVFDSRVPLLILTVRRTCSAGVLQLGALLRQRVRDGAGQRVQRQRRLPAVRRSRLLLRLPQGHEDGLQARGRGHLGAVWRRRPLSSRSDAHRPQQLRRAPFPEEMTISQKSSVK